jgi:hypothetical protein
MSTVFNLAKRIEKMSAGDLKEPIIKLEMFEQPAHSSFTRFLTFENHFGQRKRLTVAFQNTGDLQWEGSFPDGIDNLKFLADTGHRNYWDRMFLECHGGSTSLPIERVKITMCYEPPGDDFMSEIEIVNWPIRMWLLSGYDEICLDEFARRSRYAWADVNAGDPEVVRMVAQDLGKSGSDNQGDDRYGVNPKYNTPNAPLQDLCSEFVSWYYYEAGIKVNGKSLSAGLIDIENVRGLHNLFEAEGALYYYDSSTNVQAFVHPETKVHYTPKPGDYLERMEENTTQHAMILFRWLLGNPNAANAQRYNRATVFNGPGPVTLRLVKIHEEEMYSNKDYWLGRID